MPTPKSKSVAVDAPIGGWDTFNSLDNMPPQNAIILDNLIPKAGTVDTREGVIVYADVGTALPVETVASLDTNLQARLIAASNGGVFDITDAGAITTIAATTTYANDKWQHKNFRKADEEGILILCNGEDTAQILAEPYTAMIAGVYTDNEESPQPLPNAAFIGVEVFKGRCYYWLDDDNAFYYTQAGSYQGVTQKYDLGSFTQRGGKLVMITTWTQQDSGDGKDDFLVFVFSTGEILVYQGDDPETIGFFEMVGRYMTAEPLSIRGRDKYGSDIIIMTKDGYIALSTIVQQGRVSDVPAFSRMITSAISERTRTRSQFFGWDCSLYPAEGLFIFNVPLSTTTFEQHVLNTVTGAWCRFKNINVNCLDVHNENLFGGAADGKVLSLLQGTSDIDQPIEFTALPAFNYLQDGGNHKNVTAAQVISTHQNPVEIELTGYADFTFPVLPPYKHPTEKETATWSINPPVPAQPSGSLWDEAFWGSDDNPVTTKGWQNISAFGYSVSVLVRFSKINDGVSWRSLGIRYNYAGAQ